MDHSICVWECGTDTTILDKLRSSFLNEQYVLKICIFFIIWFGGGFIELINYYYKLILLSRVDLCELETMTPIAKTNDLHANYVDCIRFYGELIITKVWLPNFDEFFFFRFTVMWKRNCNMDVGRPQGDNWCYWRFGKRHISYTAGVFC
jgi:hypothetical protein